MNTKLLCVVLLAVFFVAFTKAQEDTQTLSTPVKPMNVITKKCCNTCVPKVIYKPKIIWKTKITNIPVPVYKKRIVIRYKSCPEGYEQIAKNKCLKTIKQKGTCPPGWIRVDDETCLRVIFLKLVIKGRCPPGFKKVGKTCIHKKEIIKELVCPKGWVKKGPYHCVREYECPQQGGWIYVKGKCIKKPINCPEGYKKLGEKCIRIEWKCPPGYRFNKLKKSCDKIVIIPKCPPGFVYVWKSKKCYLRRCVNKKCPAKPKTCPPGQFWKVLKGQCCGSCVECSCSLDWNPVCTDQGATYPNECIAKCLHATIKHFGKCEKKDRPPREECPPEWHRNENCEYKCLDKPFKPVCTTDNVTLPSSCLAKCLRKTVAYSGKCKAKKVCIDVNARVKPVM